MITHAITQVAGRLFLGIAVAALLFVYAGFAADPAVKLPPFPTKAQAELYEDSEEMFAGLLLKYFQTAATLEAQLNSWGVKPAATLPSPTLEELSSQEMKTLRKFYTVGLRLQSQIEALPEDSIHAHLLDVRKRLKEEREKNINLRMQNFELDLKSQSVDAHARRIEAIVKRCDSIKQALDSLSYERYMLEYSSNTSMARALDDSFIPTLLLSNSIHALSIGASNIRHDISYGAKAELNLNSLPQFGKYLDLWFAYFMPQIQSNPLPQNAGSRWREWNSNIYSVGVNLNLGNAIDLSPARAGIKIGAGHYWGSASSPNAALPNAEYKGQMLNLELSLSRFTTISPAGVYFNFGVLFPSRDMIFSDPGLQSVNIGRTTITTFGLGLRFHVL